MTTGVAFLEAGFIRKQNMASVFLKNLLDCCILALAWYLLGYGFAFGGDTSGFIGTEYNLNLIFFYKLTKSFRLKILKITFFLYHV